MNREEAKQYLIENCVSVQVDQWLEKIDQQFHQEKEALFQPIVTALSELFAKISRMQGEKKLPPVAYIHFSILRTSLLEKQYTYLLEAYGETWYYDLVECHAKYEAGWLNEAMQALREVLENERRAYMGLIHQADLELMMQQAALLFHQYLIQLVRYLFRYQPELVPDIHFETAKLVRFRVGEYKGFSEDVATIDQRKQAKKDLLSWLQKKEADKTYTYENFFDLPLEEKDLSQLDFSYAQFTGSNLTKACLKRSICQGTGFVGCEMANSDLSYAVISDADFRQANLAGADFRHALGPVMRLSEDQIPGYFGIDFREANLENAHFEFAQIAGANFTGAKLAGAKFFKRDQAKCQFSPDQIKEIIWLE